MQEEKQIRSTIVDALFAFLRDKFSSQEEICSYIDEKLAPELIKIKYKDLRNLIDNFENNPRNNGRKVMEFLKERKLGKTV